MAETFAARRLGPAGFDQRVCVKRVLPIFREDTEFVRLFLEEARLTTGLAHVNIVQVVDFGEVEDAPFLALELVRGVDLRCLLRAAAARDERIPAGIVTYLAHELCAALEHAHAEHVVHRDISPSNVLVSIVGETKLTDFGIAKALAQPRYTQTRIVKGKIPYMAPEYGRHGRFDQRSDLYALGVTLYECAAGRRPYVGANEIETLERALTGDHPPLPELAPDVSPPLADLIHRLIRPEPDHRFATARALAEALEGLPPPPTARRLLATAVAHEGPAERAKGGPSDGTLRLEGTEAGVPEAVPQSAPADALTRTRAPLLTEATATRASLGSPSDATRRAELSEGADRIPLWVLLALLLAGVSLAVLIYVLR